MISLRVTAFSIARSANRITGNGEEVLRWSTLAVKMIASCALGVVLLRGGQRADAQAFNMDEWAPRGIGTVDSRGFLSMGTGGGGWLADGKKVVTFDVHINKDSDKAPLPRAASDRYLAQYCRLQEYDLFPLQGHVYQVGPIQIGKVVGRSVGATRLSTDEVPEGIQSPRLDAYVFPLCDDPYKNGMRHSGTLHRYWVYVWDIEPANDASKKLRAKIGTLPYKDSGATVETDQIVWKWCSVGDNVDIGGFHHTVVGIVPPKEPEKPKRGRARMVGWIELDRRAHNK